MKFPKAFTQDCLAVKVPTLAQGGGTLCTTGRAAVQRCLQDGGLLDTTVITGGLPEDRGRLLMAVHTQTARAGLPFVLLTDRPVRSLPDVPCFFYDPFQGHDRRQAAFLLAQTARCRKGFDCEEIAFSLDALLRHWEGSTLRELLAASCEELELRAQQYGPLPFAERAEFRRVFYLMEELRRVTPGDGPTASVEGLLQSGGQLILRHPLHWAMALKEAELLCDQWPLVCEDAPFGELPGAIRPLLRGHTILVCRSLPGELSAEDWDAVCSRGPVSVVFAHPSALDAQKLADYYGSEYVTRQEYSDSVGQSWLEPWSRTRTRGHTTQRVRQNQILPETIQNLQPGAAIVTCAAGRCLCSFRVSP